jgi:hypothetical protein
MAFKLTQGPLQTNMADVQRTLRQQYPDQFLKPQDAPPPQQTQQSADGRAVAARPARA